MTHVCLVAVVALLRLTPAFAEEPPAQATEFVQIRDADRHREHRAMPDYRRLCGFCHGDQGAGDGLNAFSLSTRPPDFTAIEWGQNKTIDGVAAVIRDGGAASGLSPDMPPWNRSLEPALILNLAELVLSFGNR